MSKKIIALSLSAFLTAPMVLAAEENEGRRLAELAFASVDSAERGFIDMGEFTNFGSDVFVSMDGDESGKISLDEYMGWDFGLVAVAEERDRMDAYETALRVVFAFRDRDGNGEISKTEHRQSMNFDFQRADLNGDAILTESEFLNGFPVMVALRAALDLDL
ncbi:signal transduction protein [uncultured Ruegeria sp.]|uniref:signal transduction protein n=1 Tax=uncultured Ruegeria sp. TaxID=259304 RepID=UPI00261C7A48|nr:signal transduction protein [uncultured Ruegeria sp.]